MILSLKKCLLAVCTSWSQHSLACVSVQSQGQLLSAGISLAAGAGAAAICCLLHLALDPVSF